MRACWDSCAVMLAGNFCEEIELPLQVTSMVARTDGRHRCNVLLHDFHRNPLVLPDHKLETPVVIQLRISRPFCQASEGSFPMIQGHLFALSP